eukprot:scaffold162233_cov31-Tisochrysis_lutea.AAC.3
MQQKQLTIQSTSHPAWTQAARQASVDGGRRVHHRARVPRRSAPPPPTVTPSTPIPAPNLLRHRAVAMRREGNVRGKREEEEEREEERER